MTEKRVVKNSGPLRNAHQLPEHRSTLTLTTRAIGRGPPSTIQNNSNYKGADLKGQTNELLKVDIEVKIFWIRNIQ